MQVNTICQQHKFWIRSNQHQPLQEVLCFLVRKIVGKYNRVVRGRTAHGESLSNGNDC